MRVFEVAATKITMDDGHSVTPGAQPPHDVAYLMTHYPRVALTFIASEIDAMERAGVRVFPIAINLPSADDIPDADARQRSAGTLYLKGARARIIAAVAATVLAHPVMFLKLLWLAITSSGADLKILAPRFAHLFYAALVMRECRARGIRHIHAHFGLTPASIAWFASELSRAGAPRLTWSFTIHGFQDFIEQKLARLDLKARSASFVACISDFTRSQLCRISDPSDWPRFHVVRCGVDLGQFAFEGVQRNGDALRIITVGRLSPEKGHVVLLHAMRAIIDQGVNAQLRLVGSGPFEDVVRAEVDALKLGGHVEFCGEKVPADVIALLKQSDIFCLPSFSEGLPVSIMEAMAIGIPVVTTWISGIPELARNGETAWTVAPANHGALADALYRAAAERASWPDITASARAAVERDHDLERNSRHLLELFDTLTDMRADRA